MEQIKFELIKNRNFNLDIHGVSISNITATDAIIIGNKIKYVGEISVIFKTNNFKKLTEIKQSISDLTVDKDGNVYAGNYDGKVYSGIITSLAIDSDDNVYVGSQERQYKFEGTVYKCLAGQTKVFHKF